MSSYNLSSYDMPPDSIVHFKKSEYMQLDMQVSVLQNKLSRAEKLLEDFERKEAANSKALNIIAKQLNQLSDSAKNYFIRGINLEIGGYIKNDNDKGLNELVSCLSTFSSAIKIVSEKSKKDINKTSSMSVKSQGYEVNSNHTVKELIDINKKLTRRLERILRSKLLCENCNTKIDIGKAVSSTNYSSSYNNRVTPNSDMELLESIGRYKSLETSKFSVFRSLKSLLNEGSSIINNNNQDKCETHINLNFINESSVFVKKSDPFDDKLVTQNDSRRIMHQKGKLIENKRFVAEQSSQYECELQPDSDLDTDKKTDCKRELLSEFNNAEKTKLNQNEQVIQRLDTIKSLSSHKSETEDKKELPNHVIKCLDNLQKQMNNLRIELASQTCSLKQIASARDEAKEKSINRKSLNSYISSVDKSASVKNQKSKQTPYFDRISLNDIVVGCDQNKLNITYNKNYIDDVDDLENEKLNLEESGYVELRKSKSLDPRISEQMMTINGLNIESIFNYNQRKPSEHIVQQTQEMFESFKFFNLHSSKTKKTENIFTNGSSEKKNLKPKKQLFTKTTNDGFFKTMRYDRNLMYKNSGNNEKTKTNTTSQNFTIKDFKNNYIPKITKQLNLQFNTSTNNKLLKPIKAKSPENFLDKINIRFKKPNELTKTFHEPVHSKSRIQNQNSVNHDNIPNTCLDSQRSLLNKIKNRIVAKKSITPRSQLAKK